MTLLLAVGLFGLCFFLLGVGFFIRGVVLKGSCGGAATVLGADVSCGSCSKKEKSLCPSDDETGLLELSNLSNPHKTLKEKHSQPHMDV